ncbi:MAG: RNA-binding S4 domain-containing protein [Planctomycetaceae bacterium]
MNDSVEPESIQLDQFLKLTGVAATGGQAKVLIQSGEVLLNNEVETRRRKKSTRVMWSRYSVNNTLSPLMKMKTRRNLLISINETEYFLWI